MTELSKYLAIISQFADKIQSHINKKYRPFLKKLFAENVQQRNKAPGLQKISLGQQLIAFKLGIQSKSTKCIQISLTYLYRLFSQGYIQLNAPNYCQDFLITQSDIQRRKVQKYEKQMKNQITKWLQPLIHFKNNQINTLILKLYEYLIAQPILNSLIDLSQIVMNDQLYSLIFSYFNYRFYLYEQVYTYKKSQIQQFKNLPINERLNGQINNALEREQAFENLIGKYLGEVVTKVCKEGGKYGKCVVCDQPAQYFCKFTKASLCGLQCKNKHLQVAQKQFKNHYQSLYLFKSIQQSVALYARYLTQKQSVMLFSVMVVFLQKPYLFQLVKPQFKDMVHKLLPNIISRAYDSKNQKIIQTLYCMIASLAKWWPKECLTQIQFFVKEHVLKVLREKKPNFRMLILVFKSLDKIFENGRSTVEMYINLDCEINQTDVIGNILFQLSKIAQDRLSNLDNYKKQQKIAIKNSCMTLFMTFSRALNDFRRNYPVQQNVKKFDEQKLRKTNLQKFVQKFNEHWSQGLKCLFNLNLVGLDSNHQIVNIIMSMAGLNKKMIDLMMFQKSCEQYLQIFLERLQENQPLVFKLLSYYKFIPMTTNDSIGILTFAKTFQKTYTMPNFLEAVKKITNILIKSQSFQDFRHKIKQYVPQDSDFRYLYLRTLTCRKPDTMGIKKHQYHTCLSYSFLQPLSSQISLLQIPLSYMLQTSYDAERIINLIKQLIPICIHANWLSLLIKHTGVDYSSQRVITPYQIKIIKGVLDIISLQSDHIMEWLNNLQFLVTLYHLLSNSQSISNITQPSSSNSSLTLSPSVNKKYQIQNRTILLQQITPIIIENSLINASLNSVSNFNRFICGVLTLAKQQLVNNQHIMMLQKYFHMLDMNYSKYIEKGVFQEIFQEFRRFIQELKTKTSTQTYIYIADMLKQLLLKILKSVENLQDDITVKHLQLFQLILIKTSNKQPKQKKQIGDFVMNSLSTIVVYNYGLKQQSWHQIIKIVDQQAVYYPYQAGVIIRKILNQHMKNINDSSYSLLIICLKLIKPSNYIINTNNSETKANNNEQGGISISVAKIGQQQQKQKMAIQAIHDIKLILDLEKEIIQQQIRTQLVSTQRQQPYQKQRKFSQQESIKMQKIQDDEKITDQNVKNQQNQNINLSYILQKYQKQLQIFKKLLKISVQQLIKFIGQTYSQAVAQTLFLLFSTKISIDLQYNNKSETRIRKQSQSSLKSADQNKNEQTEYSILSQQQLNTFISLIFTRLQQIQMKNAPSLNNSINKDLTLAPTSLSQRIMNQCLYWCVKNKNKGIIYNLQQVILHKYTNLSITALKCIKTYIQMSNLRDQKDWHDVEETLLRVIRSSQVQRYFRSSSNCGRIQQDINNNQQIQRQQQLQQQQSQNNNQTRQKIQKQIQNLLTHSTTNPSQPQTSYTIPLQFPVENFIHECRLQMLSVQLLPNHMKCLQCLKQAYINKVIFNDNMALRIQIWKKIGITREYPPDLLMLEETISNRIMAIYIWENSPKEIYKFSCQILDRYILASDILKKLLTLQNQPSTVNEQNYENWSVMVNYWQKRRQPLIKLISYIMPKLHKYIQTKQQRKKLLKLFVKLIPLVQTNMVENLSKSLSAAASATNIFNGSRQSVLKVIKDLADKQINTIANSSSAVINNSDNDDKKDNARDQRQQKSVAP